MNNRQVTGQRWLGVFLVGGALALAGCSSARPPTEIVSQAELAVQRAGSSKASEHAPLELHMAREQLASARKAMQAEDYTQARRLAERALLQAQVAEAKAEAESTRRTAEELRKSIESLRQETLRR